MLKKLKYDVELIPLIELTYFNELAPPNNGPYWEYPNEWETYTIRRLKKAGFSQQMRSYIPGSSFFQPSEIPVNNLKKIIDDWFKGYNGENTEEIVPLYGGYALNVNGEDLYFPQCCGDLGDIVYWEKLVKEKKCVYNNGHPSPNVSITDSKIEFQFNETDEKFCPPTPKVINLNIESLEQAYERTLIKLREFETKILKTNKNIDLNLSGKELIHILVYRNQELMN